MYFTIFEKLWAIIYFLALTSDKMYYSSQNKRTESAGKLRYQIFYN